MIEIAVDAATAAGHAILQVYAAGLPQTGIKADNPPITQADRSSHAIIAHHLARTGLPVISEEEQKIDFKKRRIGEYCWLVDPLDGTKEFLAGNGEFTVNIGLVRRGKPVAGVVYIPHNDVLYAGSA